ncbi:mannose-6-phosphate isomerase, class I [Vibrio sp. F13]|nr:mannose-6-phosphate isomerase, class I [Vibrio sp. F13]
MDNVIQNYAWGSKTALVDLFKIDNTSNAPQAEIWMGAHSRGSSSIHTNQKVIPLSEVIQNAQEMMLGDNTKLKFGELPYLFKVLAAETALSIQVHPSKQQAEHGYALEEQLGIPLNASNRNYKDPNHKPELVYALTDYQALNGFRSYQAIIDSFAPFKHSAIKTILSQFKSNPTATGLRIFFQALLELDGENKCSALAELYALADQQFTIKNTNTNEIEVNSTLALVRKLCQQYPEDIGLFSPLLLNVITLCPGQAMYLSACTPHAYIQGTALEIMANSDNVLRAGLTAKHIDVAELIRCTRFVPTPFEDLLVKPENVDIEQRFPTQVEDFSFSILEHPLEYKLVVNSAEILFAIDEDATLRHQNGEILHLKKGQSAFIPAFTQQYVISSSGRIARAYN